MSPYFGDVRWWRQYLELCLNWAEGMPQADRRSLTRCRLTAPGREPLTLSIPIQGGASAAKRMPPAQWRLSGHGRWQAVHLGALEAFYGRMPFYRHLADRIGPLIENARTGESDAWRVDDLTSGIHDVIATMLDIDRLAGEICRQCERRPALMRERRDMLAARFDDEDCILSPLMSMGPEAIFLLLPAL